MFENAHTGSIAATASSSDFNVYGIKGIIRYKAPANMDAARRKWMS